MLTATSYQYISLIYCPEISHTRTSTTDIAKCYTRGTKGNIFQWSLSIKSLSTDFVNIVKINH